MYVNLQHSSTGNNGRKYLQGLRLFLLFFLLIAANKAIASNSLMLQQNVVIKGTVIDAVSKQPVAGVTVEEVGTNNGTATNEKGEYQLTLKSGNATVSFRSIGYKTVEVPVNNQDIVNVSLTTENAAMDEVVVVGYGTQKKSDLTGSVNTISSRDMEGINAPNLVDKIQGKVPGLSINTGNARPGEVASLTVRGENSISASNQPLIILDGVPFNGSFNDINTSSIENISVLKDASATAIYGSRAANGVILVTSKKGQAGKTKVSYNGYIGVQMVERRLNLMNGPEYIQYLRDYQISKGKTGDDLNPEKYLFANVLEQWKKGEDIDWQQEIFNNTALITEHQLNLSGGTEKSNYFAGVGYLKTGRSCKKYFL